MQTVLQKKSNSIWQLEQRACEQMRECGTEKIKQNLAARAYRLGSRKGIKDTGLVRK